MASPRRRRGRAALILLGVAIALPAAGWVGLNLLLRDEVLRPRLITAVEQATGRSLTLSGPVGIKLSLVPTVTLRGVTLANAPGGSRPEMLTARRVEAELALLPLLRRQLAFERLTLIEPDLLLELDAEGRSNWRFGPPRSAQPAQPSSPAAGGSEPLGLTIAAIEIEGGKLSWRDASRGVAETLEIRRWALEAPGPEAPMRFQGQLGFRGVTVAAEGNSGPLPRLLGATAGGDWPLRLALAAPGIQLVADGAVAQPEAGAGWRLSLNATADRAARLAPFLRGVTLPEATGLDLTAELQDAGPGALPLLRSAALKLATLEAGAWLPGLRLGATRLTQPAPDQPLALNAALSLRGIALQAEGSLPPLPALLGDGPWPLRLALRGEGQDLTLEGQLQGLQPLAFAGSLSGSLADSAPWLRAFALPGPRLTEARLATGLALAPQRLALDGLRLQSRQAVLEGEAALALSGRPALTGRLAAQRLDLDALLQPPPAVPAASPAAPNGAAPQAPAVPPRPPAAAPAGPRRVIPDWPLPFALLQALDADLPLTIAELVAGGVTYRDLRAPLKLADGRLGLEPFGATLPGGRVNGRLAVDGAPSPPRLALTLRHEGGGLDLRPMLQAYGLPPQGSGRLEVEADLTAQGGTPRALAASGNGVLALAMANGQIDNRLIASLAGDLRRLLLPNAPTDGSTALRCLALRLQARDGIARPQAMLVETSLADVVGSGEIDLREERLALRLLPQIRLGGLGLSAPVLVGGSFASPSYRLDPAGVPEAAAGIVGDLVARQRDGQGGILGQLAQQLAGRQAGSLPDCAQQLAVARNGRGGPVPAEAPQRRNSQERSNPMDLLRGLLGR